MRLVACALALLALAGCAAPAADPAPAPYTAPSAPASPNGDMGVAANNPTRHDVAANSALVTAAGTVFSHAFEVQGQVPVSYRVTFADGSTADMGFVRASDLAEYEQGQSVTTWAYQSNSLGTSQQVTLPAGDYAFVVFCLNSFLDCDGSYDLWATY